MTIDEKREYDKQWRLSHPNYHIEYGRKYRKTSNYEMIKYKLRKSGFYIKKANERKEYHQVYTKQRWKKAKESLSYINTILGYEDYIDWKFIPKTTYKYAVSDTGEIYDMKKQCIIPQKTEQGIKVVYLPHYNKIIRLKVPYAVLFSHRRRKNRKRFWVGYIDGNFKNTNVSNLVRVFPIEELLKSQFYKDMKSVNFSFWYYCKLKKIK